MSFSRINLAVFGLVLVFAVVIHAAPPRKIKDDDNVSTYGGAYQSQNAYAGETSFALADASLGSVTAVATSDASADNQGSSNNIVVASTCSGCITTVVGSDAQGSGDSDASGDAVAHGTGIGVDAVAQVVEYAGNSGNTGAYGGSNADTKPQVK